MKRGFTLLEVMLALAIFALAAMAVLQIASGALSNQQILEEKTVAGWVAENQTALLYLMTREQRAVRHQGESDMAGSRWYWRTTPLSTGNALLQAVDIEVSRHEDFSSVISHDAPGLAPWEANSEKDLRWFHVTGNAGGNCHFCLTGTDGAAGDKRRYTRE